MTCADCGAPCQGARCLSCERQQIREGDDGHDPMMTDGNGHWCVLCGGPLEHDLELDTGVCDDCAEPTTVNATGSGGP